MEDKNLEDPYCIIGSFLAVYCCLPHLLYLSAVHQQLLDYEQKIFGSGETIAMQPVLPPESLPSFGFGLPVNTSPAPVFNQPTTASIFDRSVPSTGSEFVFGAGRNIEQRVMENNAFVVVPPTGGEAPMDSS